MEHFSILYSNQIQKTAPIQIQWPLSTLHVLCILLPGSSIARHTTAVFKFTRARLADANLDSTKTVYLGVQELCVVLMCDR